MQMGEMGVSGTLFSRKGYLTLHDKSVLQLQDPNMRDGKILVRKNDGRHENE